MSEELTEEQYMDLVEIWALNPVECIIDLFGDYWVSIDRDPETALDSWAKDALMALTEEHFMAITGANGVGKTAFAVQALCWFIATRPGALIPVTSTDQIQLFTVFWAELKRWYDRAPILQQFFEYTNTRIYHKEKKNTWFAVARTSRTQKEEGSREDVSSGLAGFHSPHLLFILDESTGIPDNWDVAEQSIKEDDNHILAISNPLRLSGRLFKIFNTTALKKYWWTKQVSYKDSSYLNHALAEAQIAAKGEDDPIVQIRFYGRFPKRSGGDTLPTYAAVESAMERGRQEQLDAVSLLIDCYMDSKAAVHSKYTLSQLIAIQRRLSAHQTITDYLKLERLFVTTLDYGKISRELFEKWSFMTEEYFSGPCRVGVDLARFGSNETVFAIRRGWRLVEMYHKHGLDATKIANRLRFYFQTYRGMELAIVDKTGLAGAMAIQDPLVLDGYAVIVIGFGEESDIQGDYYNQISEMWLSMEEKMEYMSLPYDEILLSQFTTRKYSYTGRKLQRKIESKEEMVGRKMESPDRAEAVCLAYKDVLTEIPEDLHDRVLDSEYDPGTNGSIARYD
jgi:hypothetical protein